MRRWPVVVPVVLSLAAGTSYGVLRPGPAPAAAETAVPVSGTSCRPFPADNYWRADISDLPRHPRSKDWLSHMSSGRDLHPDFGPSFGDGPNYGIPITVVGSGHRKVRVRFDYASESDRCATRWARTPGSRAAGTPPATSTP